jgi:nucleoside-diphosphate-sugar epimerase
MRIFVTGASGFIGSHLVAALADTHQVFAAARHRPAAASPGVTWIEHDFAAAAQPTGWPAAIDAVVHLAQSRHYRSFPEQARDIYSVGLDATMRLLDWARTAGARKFVLASTGGLYGAGPRPFREQDPVAIGPGPLAFYFTVKRLSEMLAEQYASFFAVTILRVFFAYGPGQAPGMLMARLIESVRSGEPVRLHGKDGIRLNPVHVADAVRVIARCLDAAVDGVVNVAGPEVVSLRETAVQIGAALDRTPRFVNEPGAALDLVADIDRLCRELVPPVVGLREGLRTAWGTPSVRAS